MNKTLILAVVVVLIAASIFLIESGKPKIPAQANNSTQGVFKTVENLIYPKAPELAGLKGFINSDDKISISGNKGKVVLIDFWTYTCINCIRTLPYVTSWNEKYAKDGLVIIGVHTPEFEFEKDYSNVLKAVMEHGIKYPVVLDNDYATWKAFKNQYWPRKYLIDKDGFIRYDHAGEGGYEETEAKIVELLKESNKDAEMNTQAVNAESVDFRQIRSPEIYFGHQFRRQIIGNLPDIELSKEYEAKIPDDLQPNLAYVEGKWKNNLDNFELTSANGSIALVYSSKNVNIVAEGNCTLEVFLDNKPLNAVKIDGSKLYRLVEGTEYGVHTLRFDATGKFKIFTFTFG